MVLEDYGMQLFLGISFRECLVEILISVFLNGMPMLKMNWVVALVLQSWVWMEHSTILIACEFLIAIIDILGKLQLLHRRCHSLDLLILVFRYTQKFDIIHGDLHDLHDTKSFLSSLEELAGYFRNDVKHHVREYKAATAFFNWEVVFFYLNSHFYFYSAISSYVLILTYGMLRILCISNSLLREMEYLVMINSFKEEKIFYLQGVLISTLTCTMDFSI